MSEPSDAASGKDATPSKPASTPASASKQSFDHLPEVDSPSISPGRDEPAKGEPATNETAAVGSGREQHKDEAASEQAGATPGSLIVLPRADRARMKPKMTIDRRTRRNAMRAATLVIAAGLGAVAGILSTHVLPSKAPKQDVASLEERQAMQKSIVLLAKEVNALKSNVDKAAKTAQAQQSHVGKTAARIATTTPNDEIVTGSIKSPAATAASTVANATVATITAPLPQPRPATAEVVKGWSAYVAPDGVVLVEQHGGDLFQVSPGVPLPGLGKVEAVNRDGGRVEVVTAKGKIVSPPRRTVRNRYYDRFPPFFEPY